MSRVFRTRPVAALVVSSNGASAVTSTDWAGLPDLDLQVERQTVARTHRYAGAHQLLESRRFHRDGIRPRVQEIDLEITRLVSDDAVGNVGRRISDHHRRARHHRVLRSTTLPVMLPRDSCARQTVERQSSRATPINKARFRVKRKCKHSTSNYGPIDPWHPF